MFAFLRFVEDLAVGLGRPLDLIAATFAEKPRGLTSMKAYPIAAYRERIVRQIEEGNVIFLELFSMKRRTGYVLYEWDIQADLGTESQDHRFCLLGVSNSIFPSGNDFVDVMLPKLSPFFSPISYGLALCMPRRFLPAGFATGLAQANMPRELDLEANAWLQGLRDRCDNELRNVFGANILNAKHLEIPVGDVPLGEWIRCGPYRGGLDQLSDRLWLWSFREGNGNGYLKWNSRELVYVRRALIAHGVFNWRLLPHYAMQLD
ncbi:MAG: hypothetical protein C0404_13335 [Verrucomicrobia bacterium]|nr:hypothetical protein [Verrucomicrobiota bacterium]